VTTARHPKTNANQAWRRMGASRAAKVGPPGSGQAAARVDTVLVVHRSFVIVGEPRSAA
jgi:hypothetical protein